MRIFLDPGHGGIDPGATFGELREKDIVLGIAIMTMTDLIAATHSVGLSRTGDNFLSLTERARRANVMKAEAFISIHTNADPDSDEPGMNQAMGSEIWIYPNSVEGRKLAEAIKAQVPNFFPGRVFRGIKEARFTVLKKTTMPAVLLELGFIDTDQSSKLLDYATQRKIAEVITAGINSYTNDK